MKKEENEWYEVPEKIGGDGIQMALVAVALNSGNVLSTETGRKAVRMTDDAGKFGGGNPGSHYVLH